VAKGTALSYNVFDDMCMSHFSANASVIALIIGICRQLRLELLSGSLDGGIFDGRYDAREMEYMSTDKAN
jgi:hypothetical protein